MTWITVFCILSAVIDTGKSFYLLFLFWISLPNQVLCVIVRNMNGYKGTEKGFGYLLFSFTCVSVMYGALTDVIDGSWGIVALVCDILSIFAYPFIRGWVDTPASKKDRSGKKLVSQRINNSNEPTHIITKEFIEKTVQQKHPDFYLSNELYKTIVENQQETRCSDENIIQTIEKVLDEKT